MSDRNTYRKRVRVSMIMRDLTTKELAEKAGLSVSHTRNLISGVYSSAQGRKKIEAALGVPVWSDIETTNPE